jgi:hypothetical protein
MRLARSEPSRFHAPVVTGRRGAVLPRELRAAARLALVAPDAGHGQLDRYLRIEPGRDPGYRHRANEKYSQTISGSFALGGKRATGTIYGALETRAKDDPGMFYRTLTISYRLSSGDVCGGTSDVTIGSAFETSFSLVTSGFPTGNCPDPPRRTSA